MKLLSLFILFIKNCKILCIRFLKDYCFMKGNMKYTQELNRLLQTSGRRVYGNIQSCYGET